jgi:hypothetical protein
MLAALLLLLHVQAPPSDIHALSSTPIENNANGRAQVPTPKEVRFVIDNIKVPTAARFS